MDGEVTDYLADDEEIEVSWKADRITSGTGVTFVTGLSATDRRLVYLSKSGDFKDIDYQHIRSVEASENESSPVWHWIGLSICAFFALFGVSLVVKAGIGGLLILAPSVAGASWCWDQIQEFEPSTSEVVTLVLADEDKNNMKLIGTKGAAADLSSTIRQHT